MADLEMTNDSAAAALTSENTAEEKSPELLKQ